jgi:hypothetical protein
MIPRIASLKPISDLLLQVEFDDGITVLYDVKEDLGLPVYQALQSEPGLFESVQLDPSRTCVYWTEDIDLPSDTIYEYGKNIRYTDG